MLDWIDIQQNNNDFFIRIPRKKSKFSALDSAYLTIEHIIKNYPKPHFLFVSGGADSQAMLYAWHTLGFPYKAISVTYNNLMNDHDLETLKIFSKKNNIAIDYTNFDVLNFLKGEYFEYVDEYRCGSPHICTHMKISELISEGTAIFGGSYMDYDNPSFVDKNNWGLYKYAKITKRSIVPYFFMETIDLAYSMTTKLPSRLEKTNGEKIIFQDINGNVAKYDPIHINKKSDIYQYNGFPVVGQDHKITGFEKIKDYYDGIDTPISIQDILQRLPLQTSKRKFDILLRNKYEYKYRQDKYEVSFYV